VSSNFLGHPVGSVSYPIIVSYWLLLKPGNIFTYHFLWGRNPA